MELTSTKQNRRQPTSTILNPLQPTCTYLLHPFTPPYLPPKETGPKALFPKQTPFNLLHPFIPPYLPLKENRPQIDIWVEVG